MKCTEVEKLLPLYVGNDITDEARALRLADHLSACAECSRTAEEFSASRDLLQSQSVPDFDAAFYQSIRTSVLADIGAHPAPRPSIFESLRLVLRQRPAFAAALALLLVFVALSVVVRRSLTDNSGHLASVESGFGEINPHEIIENEDAPERNALTPRLNVKEKLRFPQQKAAPTVAQQKKQSVENEGTRPEDSATVVQNGPAPSVTPSVPRNDSVTTNDAQPAQAIARMEIQTSDPNIRIIWLGRKPSE